VVVEQPARSVCCSLLTPDTSPSGIEISSIHNITPSVVE
jgi:hypothetical protein